MLCVLCSCVLRGRRLRARRGAVHAGQAAPHSPTHLSLGKEPSAAHGQPTPPDASPVLGPPALRPSLLPGPAPGQWTVLTCVALVPPLPACSVCHRAVIARMPSASALVAARAVPATLACTLPGGGRWMELWVWLVGRGGERGWSASQHEGKQVNTQAPEPFGKGTEAYREVGAGHLGTGASDCLCATHGQHSPHWPGPCFCPLSWERDVCGLWGCFSMGG